MQTDNACVMRCPDKDRCLLPEDYTPPRRTVKLGLCLCVKFPHNGRTEEGFIVDGPFHIPMRTENFDSQIFRFEYLQYETIYTAHAYEVMGTSRRVRQQRIIQCATDIEPVIWTEGVLTRIFRFITGRKRKKC